MAALFCTIVLQAQTQQPVYLTQPVASGSVKGFYEYLPANYNSNTKKHPLIIWVHGAGQVGQGNPVELPKVLEWGVPKIINENGFPSTFTVGDSTFSFIIISPQFISWPYGNHLSGMIDYAVNNYRVDVNRIYLMGISAGGGAVWDYASASVANSNNIAAIIPFCGTMSPTQAQAGNIAASNLPVWAFHNTNDGTVPVANSRNWKNYINSYTPAPNPLALLTEFPVVSNDPVIAHECWSTATLPSYKPNGINLYEWLLQYRKRVTASNIPPVARAGNDVNITLPENLFLNGSLSNDPDGSIVTYRWKKISGPVSYSISDTTIANPTVSNLSAGIYSFQLTVTDNLNAIGRDTVLANVSAPAPPGTSMRVLIDAGSSSLITSSPATNGFYWNNMTDGRPGTRITNAKTTTNASTTIGLDVINRIDGTYNTGGTGMNNANNTGAVAEYPASATNDYAFAHNSTTSGRWKIKGLEADKSYVIKFWGTRSGEINYRDIEIKRSDETVWKSYNAGSNTNINYGAYFSITGKTEMDFEIRVKANSTFGYINVVDITWNASSQNQRPVANAGADQNLTVPVDSVMLNGCTSSDPENALLIYKWRKISGPASFTIIADNACSTSVKNLIAGYYTFELLVTDTGSLTHRDTVGVTVNAANLSWPTLPPPTCPQPYKLVTLGSSTAVGTGASPIDSSWMNKFRLYVQQQNAQISVINLSVGGFNTYHINPSDFTPPTNRPQPDMSKNITAALALNPDAIIINMPSNDAASSFTLQETQDNFNRIVAKADAQNVPVWVTTSQPRNDLSSGQVTNLIQLKDWINQRFGNKAIDFWSNIANSDGTINTTYSSGDGIHVNNYGHHILFTRALYEKIWDSICIRRSVNYPPVANAGPDQSVTATPLTLNGSASSDPEGQALVFSWRILNNANGSLTNSNTAQPVFSANSSGTYIIELTVTDNGQLSSKDSVSIFVNLPNRLPVANAGNDQTITLPANSVSVSGTNSSDPDGTITGYSWRKISGPAGFSISNTTLAQTNISFSQSGQFGFELTVTDNSGGIGKDSVLINVIPESNTPPVANAGADQIVQLPQDRVRLDGRASYDQNGTITSYLWTYISGPAGSQLFTPSKDTCTVNFTNAGTYIFRLTVTDNGGLTATDDIKVTVQPATVQTGGKGIKINVYDGTVPYINPQWNNWIPASNVNSVNFKYADGSQSSVNINLSSHPRFSDNGATYGQGAVSCPAEVLRFNSIHSINRTLTVNGLDPAKPYRFEFYGSRGFTSGSKTIFTVGNLSDTIDTDFNLNDLAQFNNIFPDNTGRIVFMLSFTGTYQYLAGLTIIEPAPPQFTGTRREIQNPELQSLSITSIEKEKREGEVRIFPNPFRDHISIELPDDHPDYKISIIDLSGNIVWTKQITGRKKVELITLTSLPKGNYILHISHLQGRKSYKIIKH
ncbi:MAG: PKD domain-containing protein [Ferruginibacter sp.]